MVLSVALSVNSIVYLILSPDLECSLDTTIKKSILSAIIGFACHD
jgi:hypothetical protein